MSNSKDNEVVVYGNMLNQVSFKGLNPTDMDIFMAACLLTKGRGTEAVTISYEKLRTLTHFRNSTTEMFHSQLRELREKLLRMTVYYETEDEVGGFVLFQTFKANKQTKELTIRVGEDWSHLLNDLTGEFTMFDLAVFAQINGKYGKTLYRMLAQFRNKNGNGYWVVDIENFRRIFDVPNTYKGREIIRRIVTPAVEEIKKYFGSLTYEPQYAKKRGKPLSGFRFEFTKSSDKPSVEKNVPTALPDQAIQEKKEKPKTATKNKFNNYSQRNYTKEQFKDIERKMMQASLVNPKAQEQEPSYEEKRAELLRQLEELEKQKK